MRAYLLTLTGRPDRAASSKQLAGELKKCGFDPEIVSAIDKGRNHWKSRCKPCQNMSLQPGQVCCADGHLRIYEKIIKDGRPALVCEDDVELLDPDSLCDLQLPSDYDWIQLYKGTWNKPPWTPIEEDGQFWQVSNGHWGTVAYFISPRGAADILGRNVPIRTMADAFFKYTWGDGNQERRAFISKRTIFRHRGILTRIQLGAKFA